MSRREKKERAPRNVCIETKLLHQRNGCDKAFDLCFGLIQKKHVKGSECETRKTLQNVENSGSHLRNKHFQFYNYSSTSRQYSR